MNDADREALYPPPRLGVDDMADLARAKDAAARIVVLTNTKLHPFAKSKAARRAAQDLIRALDVVLETEQAFSDEIQAATTFYGKAIDA